MRAHRKDILPRGLRPRGLLTAFAVAALLASIVTLVARARPVSNVIALLVSVGSPYVPLMALSGLALLMLCRRVLLSLVAVAVVAATLAVQVPWYYFGRPADVGRYVDIRVLSSNLDNGQAEAPSFVGLAKENADVITVSELTPEEAMRLSQAGIDEAFPYSRLIPLPGAQGIGLWSRFPIAAVLPPAPHKIAIIAVRLRVPGVRFDPVVASVHLISPIRAERKAFRYWRIALDVTKEQLNDFAGAAGPGAVIAAGDFNTTPDVRQFRDLLTNGYHDAVEQAGAGFAPTFPSRRWFPPLITIDHVLTRQATASSIRTVDVRGSDHRSLMATIKVPLDPTASQTGAGATPR